ncbi:MAG TPA: FliM/FliN family flagellar motor switch protein [Planctomycetota bacterium]|nr:FliM/FliN family flagellar motor switch protein [Planctomycetota bacterium]
MAQTQVEPEEAQAILDAVRADDGPVPSGSSVAARDFARPLRLSVRDLGEIAKRVAAALPAAEKELGRALRGAHTLTVSELREESAEGLFADVGTAFVVLRFEVEGQPGWLCWDAAGAVAALEVVLGAPEATPEERALTGVERALAGRLLGDLLARLVGAVGVTSRNPRMVALADDLGSWRDAGPRADRARLRIRLELDGPAGHGGLDLWLPGVRGADEHDDTPEGALPQHLDPVAVELSAHLGTCDVPLRELLQLAVGDVIPLDTPDDADLTVLVEDVPCARARLGTHAGHLALQILDVTRPDDDS